MFLMATLMLFFDLTNPVSKSRNPPCIKKTRATQRESHNVSMFCNSNISCCPLNRAILRKPRRQSPAKKAILLSFFASPAGDFR